MQSFRLYSNILKCCKMRMWLLKYPDKSKWDQLMMGTFRNLETIRPSLHNLKITGSFSLYKSYLWGTKVQVKQKPQAITIHWIESLFWRGKELSYFLDYKTHLGFTGGKQENKPHSTAEPPPTPSEPGELHLDYKTHPHFLPKFGGGEVHLIVRKNYSSSESSRQFSDWYIHNV